MIAYILPSALLAFVISAALTPVCGHLAKRLGLLDAPHGRKTHRAHTPLLGGLAIVSAFIAAALVVIGATPPNPELIAILAGVTVLAAIGLLDDGLPLSPWWRLLVQGLVSGLAIYWGPHFEIFENWIDYAVTIFWIVGITNAVNFLDNMDGLASGLVAITASALALLLIGAGQWLMGTLSAALAGAALGFFLYNRYPARIFMGDMGSLPLGYVIAIAGVEFTVTSKVGSSAWMITLVAFSVIIFDLVLVVLTRLAEKRSPFQAGSDHISHRLVSNGMHPRRAAAVIHLASLALGITAIAMSAANPGIAIGIFGSVSVLALLASFYFVRLRRSA